MKGNTKNCRECEDPIEPDDDAETETLAAWIAGFCGETCMHTHAVAEVSGGTAWWQKGGVK